MATLKELADLVKILETQLAVCTRCGTCQSVCPLFEQTGREADVARGKLTLLDGLISHIFSSPDGVLDRLNRCLLCGSCAANCPSSVNIIEIFIRARTILTTYNGLPFFKRLIFKTMLTHPERFNRLIKWAGQFQRLFIKSNQNRQGTSCARFNSPLIRGRHFLPIADRPFHQSLDKLNTGVSDPKYRVLLFTGCLIDKIMPNIGAASIKALNHNRVEVVIPETQGCCGIPALASGDQTAFNRLVEHHIHLLKKEQFDYIVTACATCTSTIRKLWPSLYSETTGEPNSEENHSAHLTFLKALSERSMDINQFLVDVVQIAMPENLDAEVPSITYHDPCHLKKSLGIFSQPRCVLSAAGHPIHEMINADRCCGMGGSFNLAHYELSGQIGNLKQQQVVETGCTTVATGCPACIMQISDMLSKAETDIRVKHPIELYADSINTTSSTPECN